MRLSVKTDPNWALQTKLGKILPVSRFELIVFRFIAHQTTIISR
jgi:hypothetical protein